MLHRPPPPGGGFPTVGAWGEGFARYRAAGAPRLPASLVDRVARIYAELAALQGERGLLHGDLHHYNVVRDATRGWLAIDPKGLLGEPAYELGAALRNPAHYPTPAWTTRRVDLMVERLGLGRTRVLGWAFAQALLAAIWTWEDGTAPAFAVAAAEAIAAAR